MKPVAPVTKAVAIPGFFPFPSRSTAPAPYTKITLALQCYLKDETSCPSVIESLATIRGCMLYRHIEGHVSGLSRANRLREPRTLEMVMTILFALFSSNMLPLI